MVRGSERLVLLFPLQIDWSANFLRSELWQNEFRTSATHLIHARSNGTTIDSIEIWKRFHLARLVNVSIGASGSPHFFWNVCYLDISDWSKFADVLSRCVLLFHFPLLIIITRLLLSSHIYLLESRSNEIIRRFFVRFFVCVNVLSYIFQNIAETKCWICSQFSQKAASSCGASAEHKKYLRRQWMHWSAVLFCR